MSRIDFGIGLGRNERISEVVRHTRAVEEYGYEWVSFIDTQNLARDVYVMMTLAATNTSRVKIGHGVTNPYTRHPAVTANATGTVHELSGGRAFLGIGAGFSSTGTLGKTPRPLGHLRDTVLAIRELSAGREVTWEGTMIRSEWMRDPFPIIIGSDGPRSMQLAGEIGDGVMLPGVDPDLTRWRLGQVAIGAERAGRSLEGYPVIIRSGCYISTSKEAARATLASYAATYAHQFYLSVLRWDNDNTAKIRAALDPDLIEDIYKVAAGFDMYEHEKIGGRNEALVSDLVIDFFMVCGTADDCIESLSGLRDAGVDRVIFSVYPLRDKLGFIQQFAEEVMPAFR